MEITIPPSASSARSKHGLSWKIAGASLALISLCFMGWAGNNGLGFYVVLAATVPFLIGRWSYRRGLRIDSITAEALIQQDGRSPVLYLRSFGDDGSGALESAGVWNSWRGDEEEQIAVAMNEIGPFIAIGKPGEALPELGAGRTYQRDEDWQDWVKRMMGSAELVVFRAGHTEGFWWEVSQAVLGVKPERILFLLPFGAAKYSEFRLRAEQYLPCKLPDHPHKPRSIWTRPLSGVEPEDNNLQAVLYFDGSWNAQIDAIKVPFYLKKASPAGGSWVPMYAYVAPPPVTFLVKRALVPVLDQLGLAWKRPPRNHIVSALLLTAAMVLIPFLYAWILATLH
jgi:hypothetical protein